MAAFLPLAISAGLSAAGGALGRDKGTKLSKEQKQQNEFYNMLLQAIQGQGPLAGLLANDEAAFQKSIVDPAMSRFNNQIAPGIQQNFIADRLQRGTGLEDALTRAGVDLQNDINSQYLDFQQGGQDRLMQLINQALGYQPNVAKPGQKWWEAAGQGLAGFGSKVDFNKFASASNRQGYSG